MVFTFPPSQDVIGCLSTKASTLPTQDEKEEKTNQAICHFPHKFQNNEQLKTWEGLHEILSLSVCVVVAESQEIGMSFGEERFGFQMITAPYQSFTLYTLLRLPELQSPYL